MAWTNRIVGHEDVDPRDLVRHDKNWRKHPVFQQEALHGLIQDVGFLRSISVNQRSGKVIDGHLRLDLALKTNQPTIPVEYVDLDPVQEAEALATIDPVAALAEPDPVQFDALLRDINSGDANVQKLLADMAHQAGLYKESAGRPRHWSSEEAETGSDEPDAEPGDGADAAPEEDQDTTVVIQYAIIFDDKPQQERWYQFLKMLRDKYPDETTIGRRIDRHITPLTQ